MTDARAPMQRVRSARGALVLFVIIGLLFTGVLPLKRYFDVRHQVAALRAQDAALDKTTAELQSKKQLLQTDDEVERLARERLGYVRPGETSFFMPKPQQTVSALPQVVPIDGVRPSEQAGLLDRWWHALTSAMRAVR
jgi:cell division protein FtsB